MQQHPPGRPPSNAQQRCNCCSCSASCCELGVGGGKKVGYLNQRLFSMVLLHLAVHQRLWRSLCNYPAIAVMVHCITLVCASHEGPLALGCVMAWYLQVYQPLAGAWQQLGAGALPNEAETHPQDAILQWL